MRHLNSVGRESSSLIELVLSTYLVLGSVLSTTKINQYSTALPYDIIPYRCQRASHLIHNRSQKYTTVCHHVWKMDLKTVGLAELGLGDSVVWGEKTFGWALEPWVFETGWRPERTEQREETETARKLRGHGMRYPRGQEASLSGRSHPPECSGRVLVTSVSIVMQPHTHTWWAASRSFCSPLSFCISSLRILIIFFLYHIHSSLNTSQIHPTSLPTQPFVLSLSQLVKYKELPHPPGCAPFHWGVDSFL